MKFLACTLFCCLILLSGCNGQKTLTRPSIDPAAAAQQAMELYDANSDGKIDKTEAKKTALDPQKGWDANGDGAIDQAEIESRLTTYDAMKPGLQMNISCTVVQKRKPLAGATVVYEPEPFLGGAVPAAEGITNDQGVANMVARDLEDPSLQGMHTGLYLVKITHPDSEVPAKYNTETELFIELSPMDFQTANPVYNLR